MLGIIALVLILVVLINLTSVQNYVTKQVTNRLAKQLNTEVSIKHVQLDLLNQLLIQGLYIEDQQNDTLLYAGEARLRITDWFIVREGVPVIKYVGLHDAYANLYRTDSVWNYQFIADAFASDKPKDTTAKELIEIDLKEVDLSNVRFGMNDGWVGSDMNFSVGKFHINADKVDLKNGIIEVGDISATSTYVQLKDYDGKRPPKPKSTTPKPIDTTAFNPGNWSISLSSLDLEDCFFSFDSGNDAALDNEFDPAHIGISSIQLEANDLQINGDTLTAELVNLAAKERSGFELKQFTADVRVSPNESVCKDLILKTNNSTIRNFYAMYYERFPDFNDYVESVMMEAHFNGTRIDGNDIAYFAPVLRQYPAMLNISGNIKGTVTDVKGRNLNITDGYSTIKGNLSMEGLPDITETYIIYTDGELVSSGQGILRYAPDLAEMETVNLEAITNARFAGDFKGYINNFMINGTLNSNLGSIVSDVKMQIAENSNATTSYVGDIKVKELELGTLLNEPELGTITLTAEVNGTESKAQGTSVKFNTIIDSLGYKGYNYTNINADGLLEKQKFTGNLLISDPNLALGFYGLFDFSDKRLKINATANLLSSDLTALKLVKGDDVHLTADFDLDWEGVSIDDFTGYAKLYNIDLLRNGHELDLDSVYVNAIEEGSGKSLTVKSNAFVAELNGQYVLSTLHNSFQYYLSGYLPNYISQPEGEAPAQDFTFNLVTYDLDSLFGILAPSLSGFKGSKVKGYLSTNKQKLELDAVIPNGTVSGITFKSTNVTANGDFKNLKVNARAGRVIFEDTSMNGTIKVNTTLGGDRLNFKIVTTSPNSIGDATLEGEAVTHGDTLDARILPSEFYLNEKKWDIPEGNRIVYTDGYLSIKDFNMKSGDQKIRIHSDNQDLVQNLGIHMSNIYVSELGKLAGLSEYNLKGRINGHVKIENLLSDMMVISEVQAKGVEFGGDTIGTVQISGMYDGKKHLVNLNPTTGIHYGDKSLTVSGKISFDSEFNENIDGEIKLNNAQLSWLSPILAGYVSEIQGRLNGAINIKGTSSKPVINGKIGMVDAAMRIDFLGTKYAIKTAIVNIDEKNIDLGEIVLRDAYNDKAVLTGGITHNHFDKMRLDIRMTSNKFEVINLKPNESELFYGNLVAKIASLSVTGPFDDIQVRINNAEPAQKSHLYLPIGTSSEEAGAYSYISFKNEGDSVAKKPKKSSDLSIHIDAQLNPLAEITMIMDPSTGDAINAKGEGNITMDIPPSNDIRMYGRYVIEDGSYTFTLPQLFFKRNFVLNKGSVIQFEGPISNTQLNVEGIYQTRARLYDLLSANEKSVIEDLGSREVTYAKSNTNIDVKLFMKGSLATPELSFKIELPDRSGAGTIAYKKLERVNQDERELFNQVASLLLVNTFIPAEGRLEGGAASGVVNNVSDIFSGTASSQLTNLLSKLTGDDDIALNLKYQKYNYSDNSVSGNRNALSLELKKNLFKDRLTIEVGSSLDWGKPTSSNSSASTFNPVGDFRLQYLIKEGGNLRGNIFRTSSYDVLADQNITRGGIGLSWRRSFNNLGELFGTSDSSDKEQQDETEENGAAIKEEDD